MSSLADTLIRPHGARFLARYPSAKKRADALPVRGEVRTLSSEMLSELNSHSYAQNSIVWEEAEDEIGEIKEALSGIRIPSWADRERWASHPDERVRLAVLERPLLLSSPGLLYLMLVEELSEAKAEENYWTPLLDAIEQKSLWPKERSLQVIFVGEKYTLMAGSAREHLETLAPDLTGSVVEDEMSRLLNFRSKEVRRAVARYSSHLPLALEQDMISAPEYWEALGENESIGLDVLRKLERTIVASLGDLAVSTQRASKWDLAAQGIRALSRMRKRVLFLERTSCVAVALLLRRYMYHGEDEDKLWWREDAELAQRLLLSQPGLERDELHAAYGWGRRLWSEDPEDTDALRAVINSPSADVALWKLALKDCVGERRMKGWIAENPRARLHPEMRPLLLRSLNTSVLRTLCADERDDFISIVRLLERLDPPSAVVALQESSDEMRGRICLEDWALMCEATDSTLRLTAIRLFGARGAGEKGEGAGEKGEGVGEKE